MSLSERDRDWWMGRIVSFYPKPEMVKEGVIQPGAKRAAGTVMGCLPVAPAKPGDLPDLTLSVRGRTGRHATISVVENYAKRHETWAEADAEP